MKKIITSCALSCLATFQVAANASDLSDLDSSLQLNSGSTLELLGEYDLGHSLKGRYQVGGSKYNFLEGPEADLSTRKAWVGVAGEFGEVRAGYHDSLDALATSDADQHKVEGAYDLIMRGDESVRRSITYMQKSGSVGLAAQYGAASDDTEDDSMGLLLNTQQGNSRIRLDLVAEKFEVGDSPLEDEVNSDSMSFMVGAKYKLTPKAYVVGQYGIIGFDNKSVGIKGDDVSLGRDYKALSLEAGYSLSDSTSVFISHSQKNYDSSSLVAPLFGGDDEASQTNSIGVRLNW